MTEQPPRSIIKAPVKEPALRRYVKRPITAGLIHVVEKLLQPLGTEATQLHGAENILENDPDVAGPYLWLAKHEMNADALDYIHYWLDTKSRFDFRFAARQFSPKEAHLHVLDFLLLRFYLFHVYRTSMPKGIGEGEKSEKKIAAMRERNEVCLDRFKRNLEQGIHAGMYPEGTTQLDGRLGEIKAGCYNLAKIERENGIDLIRSVPLGLTYDFLSGDKKWFKQKPRRLVFVNVGKPFCYEPIAREADEKDETYVKRDIKQHTRRVHDYFIDLNTITMGQLAGEYVLRKVQEGKNAISKAEIDTAVTQRVAALQKITGVAFDDALLAEGSFAGRLNKFYDNLQRLGYLTNDSGQINVYRMLARPDHPKRYRAENPLLYCVNRLLQVMEERPSVKKAIDGEK